MHRVVYSIKAIKLHTHTTENALGSRRRLKKKIEMLKKTHNRNDNIRLWIRSKQRQKAIRVKPNFIDHRQFFDIFMVRLSIVVGWIHQMNAEHWTQQSIHAYAYKFWALFYERAYRFCILSISFFYYFISMLLTWHKLIQLKYTRAFVWIFFFYSCLPTAHRLAGLPACSIPMPPLMKYALIYYMQSAYYYFRKSAIIIIWSIG